MSNKRKLRRPRLPLLAPGVYVLEVRHDDGVFARTDGHLHDLIAEASGNAFLAQAQIRLHAHVHLFRLYYDARVSQDAIGEHEQLLAAIGSRDEAAAEQAMRRHLRASRARLYAAFAGDDELGLDTPDDRVHDRFSSRNPDSA